MTRDGADRLLASAVRLLPASHHEWGTAMRAELTGVEGRPERLRFALGCARAVVGQPAVLRAARHPVLTVAIAAAVVAWTRAVAYPPLHWGLVASVLVLLAVSWLGRLPGPFGPVHDSAPARAVRTGGYLLVAGVAIGALTAMRSNDNPGDQAAHGVPGFTVALTLYLLGFLTVTGRRLAARRVLVTAASVGGAAGAVWVAAAVALPPVPPPAGLAVALTAGAAMVAVALTVDRSDRRVDGLLAALSAASVTALLVVAAVFGLGRYASPALIPDLAPQALSPADDLAQSRIELVDHYLVVLLLGGLLAGTLAIVGSSARRATPAAEGQEPSAWGSTTAGPIA